jgi:hypothetical protein
MLSRSRLMLHRRLRRNARSRHCRRIAPLLLLLLAAGGRSQARLKKALRVLTPVSMHVVARHG